MIRRMMCNTDISRNVEIVKNKITQACLKRSSYLPNISPLLVAVSKTKPKELVIEAYHAGVRHFGENYVQEIVEKAHDEEVIASCPEIKWHFIGHLQKNKVNKLLTIPNLYLIETVDSLKLASAINTSWSSRQSSGEALSIYLQINTSGEAEKSGCKPEEVVTLAQKIQEQCPLLKIKGLMTIGKYDNYSPVEAVNPDFSCLLSCREPVARALQLQPNQIDLSMGMSADFEHAVSLCSCYLVQVPMKSHVTKSLSVMW